MLIYLIIVITVVLGFTLLALFYLSVVDLPDPQRAQQIVYIFTIIAMITLSVVVVLAFHASGISIDELVTMKEIVNGFVDGFTVDTKMKR